ncbi:MAG: AI-2E family transporter [Elusimicrobia bacterium]|nr:AI-2E family transporter [Elusimicrobiota bacterium]MDE2426430.1 AI-2E family transporter [Elusimicrobiota bacterium]
MPSARAISLWLFAALIAAACAFHLGPAALAGLFAYMILDLAHRPLSRLLPNAAARWLSILLFLIAAAGIGRLFVRFLSLAAVRMPLIASSVIPMLSKWAQAHGLELPFGNLQELHAVLLRVVKENAKSITIEGGLLTKSFFYVLLAVFVAIGKFLPEAPAPARPPSLFSAVLEELRKRVGLFMNSYEKVLGAQVVISLANAAITAVFIALAGIPYIQFLTLSTFLLGVIPIVGNLAANLLIVGAALTQGPELALVALAFLFVSHKAQYLLVGRIIGSTLKTPMWAMLLGILAGEIVLGLPGIILAPALMHYAREELSALPPPQ